MLSRFRRLVDQFLHLDAAGGILLLAAAILALAAENSPAKFLYDAFLDTPVELRFGAFHLAKPLLLWINDGLMAVFFLLVGLEIKREVLQGELADTSKLWLPSIAAVGGMLVPALIYLAFNHGSPTALSGWAVPTATDIAFALGVLSLFGSRVPLPLKLFLLTLAIIDDLGAIVIIAIFYTKDLSLSMLLAAAVPLLVLLIMNRSGVTGVSNYLAVGFILWATVLKSGVHATLAGVILAFFIPLRLPEGAEEPPLLRLEHDLQPTVTFLILPLFAFANTGISLAGLTPAALLAPVPLGIALGLFLGKIIGVLLACWLGIKLGLGQLAPGVGWGSMAGVASLCGIGFTMSLFISTLAFSERGGMAIADERLGILVGSTVAALVGLALLHRFLPQAPGTGKD